MDTMYKASCLTLLFCDFQGTDITLIKHQEVILWLKEMNTGFQFCQETYALAVCVLNRLLATVKVSIS